jgi:hypothetical protein
MTAPRRTSGPWGSFCTCSCQARCPLMGTPSRTCAVVSSAVSTGKGNPTCTTLILMAGDWFFLCRKTFIAGCATLFVITVGYYPYYYVIQRYATSFSNSVYFMTHLTRPKNFIMVFFAVPYYRCLLHSTSHIKASCFFRYLRFRRTY